MKLYSRSEFIKMPKGTVYSYPSKTSIAEGLFMKESDSDYLPDFVEQNLIEEPGFPNSIKEGGEAWEHVCNLMYSGQEFRMDLNCCGRQGLFDDSENFIVYDKEDVEKLIEKLKLAL